jgi:hypothetical protein
MAPSVAIKKRGAAGDMWFRTVDITLDATYAAGGWALTPAQLGFGANGVIQMVDVGTRGGFLFEWDQVNNKLMARDCSGGVGVATPEAANALAALNGLVVRALVFGSGSPG